MNRSHPQPYLWWQTGVIYQIYPRSFKDSNGDGIGDLGGVIEKMDYLSDILGVDAIWLSPFYPSPMADFGYDVSDYTGVHPIFGSLEIFKELLAQAHRRQIHVIIDFVPNHSSDRHPWFVESRASRRNPKRDWYFWVDAKPDGSPPNNWISNFGGPAWEWDQATGQYYLHAFLKEQPDLNWRNPEVREAMFGVLRFWLDLGVDGFRIDVAHFIMKDPDLHDNPPNPEHRPVPGVPEPAHGSQLHLYDKNHPDVHRVFRDLRKLLDAYSQDQPRMAVGEIHIFEWPKWILHYGLNLDELHMPFNFSLLKAPWRASTVRALVDGLEAALPEGAWPNYVLGNHDEPRLASRYGRPQARIAAMLLLTLRGTPTLYYGDEVGMINVKIPPEKLQDPVETRIPGSGRDPSRTPMQWTPGSRAGFSGLQAAEPWLPLSPDYPAYNVETELGEPASMLNLYRSLLSYRREHPVLQTGAYTPLEGAPQDVFWYLRQAGKQRILVALNFSPAPEKIALADLAPGQIALSTHMDRRGPVEAGDLELRGNEGLIIEIGG